MTDIPVAILAGGLGTRLHTLTEKIPKVLIPVAGRPFLAHQLRLLKRQGIRRVVLCLGHLGEQVVERFGPSSEPGLELDYSFDGPALLGTGGALKQAASKLGECFWVLYGDSYLTASFGPIAECFVSSGKTGLMTVYRNENQFDRSNIVFADGEIKVYDKQARSSEMRHIDYGLSLLRADVLANYRTGQRFDLADLMSDLVARRQLAGYETKERFYEIGSSGGLAELESLLSHCGIPDFSPNH